MEEDRLGMSENRVVKGQKEDGENGIMIGFIILKLHQIILT